MVYTLVTHLAVSSGLLEVRSMILESSAEPVLRSIVEKSGYWICLPPLSPQSTVPELPPLSRYDDIAIGHDLSDLLGRISHHRNMERSEFLCSTDRVVCP